MEKQKISIQLIRSLQPGQTFQDTEASVFFVARRKDKVVFFFRKRHHYKLIYQTIGYYPVMQPPEARLKALAMLGNLENYNDISPISPKQEPTIKDIADFYLAKFADNRRQYVDTNGCLKKFLGLYGTKITEVTKANIEAVHLSLKETPVSANHAVKRLSAAVNWYNKQMGTAFINPCAGIALNREKPRQRFLDNEEGTRLVQQLEIMRHSCIYHSQADALLLMLYTGQRKSNVLAMRVEEIHDGIWVIPGEKSKSGREIVVPLNSFALAILDARQSEINGGWIFPSHSRTGNRLQRLKSCRHTFSVACKTVGISDCHIHDLRRTLGSWMLINGASIAEVSRTLGHSSIKVTEQVYA